MMPVDLLVQRDDKLRFETRCSWDAEPVMPECCGAVRGEIRLDTQMEIQMDTESLQATATALSAPSTRVAGLCVMLCCVAPVLAQPTLLERVADRDRWVYPFNGTPGTRFVASVFAAPLIEGFDDRDAQFVMGWDTAATIPTGLDHRSYTVNSAVVRAWISSPNRFVYDPSADPNASSYFISDPAYVPDVDPGRPIELWPVGYRDGFDLLSWEENSPFSVSPPVIEPSQGNRVIFAAQVTPSGATTDVSNSLKQRFETTPAAIGSAALTPGASVPADTRFSFTLDLCQPGVRAYVQRSLAQGRLNLALAAMHPVDFDPDSGPTTTLFPSFYTSENPLATVLGFRPRIELSVTVTPLPDFDRSGAVNVLDVVSFINAWQVQDPTADLDGNCQYNVLDVIAFIQIFNG